MRAFTAAAGIVTVDNWQGYTYTDGSYKTKTAEYYDAPAHRLHLPTGETLNVSDKTSAVVIKMLRAVVQKHGGYDANLIRNAMMARIQTDHRSVPPKPQHP